MKKKIPGGIIMIKERELDHIGLCVTDVETNAKWYQEVLGFKVKGCFFRTGHNVYFLDNSHTVYEMYQEEMNPACEGKIDHISYVSYDVEKDYQECIDGIEYISEFWERGIRYFKIKSRAGKRLNTARSSDPSKDIHANENRDHIDRGYLFID